MHWLKRLAGVFVALVVLAMPMSAQACPSWKEAITSASGAEDEQVEASNLPRAYNQSIYLMVSVPYLALGVVGFLIYRGCKKNAEYLKSIQETPR